MTDTDSKIVIVGGGIAGLCSGVYALRCGYDVEIVEMHERPGGLATSWRRGDYTFETCLHWLLGSSPGGRMHEHWREVFDIDQLRFVRPAEYVRLEAEGGERLAVYTDPDRLEAELLRISPEDEAESRRFVAAVRAFRDLEIPEPPERLRDWVGLIASLPHLPAVQHWMGISLKDYAQRFQHPLLRRFFTGGESTNLSAIAVVLTLAWMGRGDADYPVGGSQAVIRGISGQFERLGGRLRLGARVEEILAEGGVATGVRLAGGETIQADWVISAADGHATIYEMLKGRFRDDAVDETYRTMEPFASYLQVSLGVALPLAAEPGYVTQVLTAPIEIDPGTRLDQVSFRIFNYDPTFAPPGHTTVTTTLPSRNFTYWTRLKRDDPAGYEAEKRRIAEAVIAVLARRIPGVERAIEVVDISTPATVIRYTGNWQGSMEGWLMTPATGLRQLPTTLPGLDRFLMAGQWVAPGGGLPGGLMSARAAVRALCHRDHRPFLPHDRDAASTST
ncbi:phytoene desaturase family protein [Caulobacter sp. KR2-114]|uniref:phytoene desaturase family protein n=1 Tax=Caulobacter sp. KR2-114 TaxID=3400912 RepID=UPI003C0BD7F8